MVGKVIRWTKFGSILKRQRLDWHGKKVPKLVKKNNDLFTNGNMQFKRGSSGQTCTYENATFEDNLFY